MSSSWIELSAFKPLYALEVPLSLQVCCKRTQLFLEGFVVYFLLGSLCRIPLVWESSAYFENSFCRLPAVRTASAECLPNSGLSGVFTSVELCLPRKSPATTGVVTVTSS